MLRGKYYYPCSCKKPRLIKDKWSSQGLIIKKQIKQSSVEIWTHGLLAVMQVAAMVATPFSCVLSSRALNRLRT